jgi:hypothetical protein
MVDPMKHDRTRDIAVVTLLLLLAAGLFAALEMVSGGEAGTSEPSAQTDEEPTRDAESLRSALEDLGGLDALTLGTAVGAFDLVRFDPLDANRLIATNRLSYGEAENQGTNDRDVVFERRRNSRAEEWIVRDGEVDQLLWDTETPYDFAHFNAGGTVTRWIHPVGTGFALRSAEVLDRDANVMFASKPIYASRFVVDGDTLFALTGDGVDRAPTDHSYVSLVADDGTRTTFLTSAHELGWINSPSPGLIVAYPVEVDGLSRVWDSETLIEVEFHALAGRNHRRAAISGDGSIAVGATFAGALEVIDLRTGNATHTFGSVDVDGIDQPVTLSHDGSIAVTVEHDGTVTLWSVREGSQIVSVEGDAVQPRWLSEYYAPRSATAVSTDATRLAVRNAARPGVSTSWTIIDIDVDSWLSG